MSDKKARQLVASLLTALRPKVVQGLNGTELKAMELSLQLAEKAMLAITKPLLKMRFQDAADEAHRYAPMLGSMGAQFFLDIVSRLKWHKLDEIRPSIVWAAAWAYNEAEELLSAQKRFLRARHLANAQGHLALAARIAIDLGVLAYNRNDIKKAKYWYEIALVEARKAKDILVESIVINNMAVRKMEQDPIIAQAMLEKSLKLKEDSGASEDSKAGVWMNLGIIFAEAGNHDQAYALFKKSAETFRFFKDYPNLALALLNLANSSSELGQFKEANALYRKGLLLTKRFKDTFTESLLHKGFAACAFQQNNFRTAASEFNELYDSLSAINEHHEAAIALHDLALSLARNGDYSGAMKTIDKAINQFKKLKDRDWYRRCLLLIASDISEANSDARLAALRKAAYLNGGQDADLKLTAIRSLWHNLIENNMFKDASRQLTREKLLLKDNHPQLKERLHYASMKLLDKGRKKEALRLLRQLEKMTKQGEALDIAQVRQDLAIVLAENRKFAEAISLLQLNIDLAKKRRDRILLAVNIGNLGEIKSRAGFYREAVSLLKKAIKLCADLHDTEGEIMWLNNLSLALSDLNQDYKAEELLKDALKKAKAASLFSEGARVLGSLAGLSMKVGRFNEAVKHYTSAIKAAEKAGKKDFALSMLLNRAAAFSDDNKKNAAMKDIRKVLQKSLRQQLYDLGAIASDLATRWAIDWRRPVSAGELAAVNLLSSIMCEVPSSNDFPTLLWIAYLHFSQKQYQTFSHALKRQLCYSDKSGMAWKKVECIQKYMTDSITDELRAKVDSAKSLRIASTRRRK